MRRNFALLLCIIVVITAVFTSCIWGECTVDFDSDGGSEIESQTVKKGEKVKKPNDPEKYGYVFDGWYVDGEEWIFSKNKVKNDVTLVARWTEETPDFLFSVSTDGNTASYTLVGLTKKGKTKNTLKIPDTFNDIKVTQIASNAFEGADKLVDVYLGANISQICSKAFYGCTVKNIHFSAEGYGADIIIPHSNQDPIFDHSANVSFIVTEAIYNDIFTDEQWCRYAVFCKLDVNDMGDIGCFLYDVCNYGDVEYLKICGLTDEGKNKDKLVIPDFVSDTPVRVIGAGAFDDSTVLKQLYLGRNIDAISAKAFEGSSIKAVYLHDFGPGVYTTVPNNLSGTLATYGADPELKIYVPKGTLEYFQSDYFWGDYISFLYEKQ